MRNPTLIAVPFKSKSSSNTYETLVDPGTGEPVSCNCPGWINCRTDKGPKTCTHCKQIRDGKVTVPGLRPGAAPRPAVVTTTPVVPAGERHHPQLAQAMPAGKTFADYVGDPAWVLEEKLDGHRVLARVSPAGVEAWSRPRAGGNGPLTRTLPAHIVEALKRLPPCVTDGELRLPGGKSWDVTRTDLAHQLEYVLFDVLECMGEPVMHLPDSVRRSYLEVLGQHVTAGALLDTAAPVRLVARQPVTREALTAIWAAGGEGAVLKRDVPYRPGYRTDAWVKVKKGRTVTLTITGFQDAKRGPCSVTELEGPLDGETVKTTVTTGAGDLGIIRQVEANPGAWIGRRIVVSFAETITEALSRKPGMSRIQLRHGIWDHVAGDGE